MVDVVQNVDVVAKVVDYQYLLSNELLVHNQFYSLQGEGPYAGRPAYFVRLAGCNYGNKKSHCQWCDTAFHLKNGKRRSFNNIEQDALLPRGLKTFTNKDLVVVTGGEPCIQPNLPAFMKFLLNRSELTTLAPTVQIETNGVFTKVAQECIDVGAKVVCSPKASANGYGKLPSFKDAASNLPSYWYKFVVNAEPTNTHHELPKWISDVDPRRVFVSPMTMYRKAYVGEVSSIWNVDLVDQELTAANYHYAAKLCLDFGYTLSVQLHTLTSLP